MRSSPSSLRWLMIALAFFATAINYLDRQTLSVAAPVLMDQFRMSNEAYARVIFAIMLAYIIANGICGPVLDRLGTRLGFALNIALVVCCRYAPRARTGTVVSGGLSFSARDGRGRQLARKRQSGGGVVSGGRTRAGFGNL